MLSISPKMQPLSNVSEREERESSTKEYESSKCQERLSQLEHGVYILLHPVTSRYVKNRHLTDCP
jgi:hypothetical protein